MTEAVTIAQAVIDADSNPFATLSLAPGLPAVTADTPVTDARRNYMRLAALIHPDKIKSTFDKATEAFQALVRAFECLADPAARKRAAAALAVAEKKKAKAAKKAPKKTSKSKRAKTEKLKRRASSRSSSASSEEFSSASEEDEDESDDEFEAALMKDAEPEVSTNRTAIGAPRTGAVYHETTIGCPNCRTRWEPDSKPQYSLFMGKWAKKIHCQLCLFYFGSATALHGCPHCNANFDYNSSMYDSMVSCIKCKRQFGFPYFPVNQHLIDQVKLDEWRDRMDQQAARSRQERAGRRRGACAGDAKEEQMHLLVGTCVMDSECPLCHKRVSSKHKQHVLECMSGAAAAAAAPVKTVSSSKKTTVMLPKSAAKKLAAKKPAAKKPATKKKGMKAPAKRRRASSDSDGDESFDDESEADSMLSDSEEESSVSSGDEDDDDSDY